MAQPSAWLTNFLAQLESPGGATRQPTTQEIAASIIRRSNKYRYDLRQVGGGLGSAQLTSSSKKPGEKGPSTIQRVMDVLSRPLYGIAEGLKQDVKHGGLIDSPHFFGLGDESGEFEAVAKGMALGVAGKRKTTSRDVYKAAGLGEGKGVGGFLRNLGTDIVIDPLNLIPIGWGKHAAKAADDLGEAILKEGTATERVERALGAKNSPEYVMGRTSSRRSVPGSLRATPARRPAAVNEELSGVPDLWRETVDTATTSPRNVIRRTNSSRSIPGTPRAISDARPVVNRGGDAAVSGVPDLWKNLLGDIAPAVPKQVSIPKAVEKIIPAPVAKAAAVAPNPVPAAVAQTSGKIPFKLDVNKIATIEVARALGSRGKALEDFQRGKQLIDSGGTVKLHALNGAEMGNFDAAKIQDYLRTGKVDAPKESEVIDYATATPEEIATFEGHLFSEKSAPENYYFKTVDESGQEQLISLAEVRKRIMATKKAKKLKDVLPDEAVAPVVSATPEPASVIDEPIEEFSVADAEDIIDAAGEGSQTAVNAMEAAVEAVATPRTRQIIDEAGGRAVAKVAERYVGFVRLATLSKG